MASQTPSTVDGGTPIGLGAWIGQARAFTERFLRVLIRNKSVLFWGMAFPAGFYLLTITLFVDFTQIPPALVGAVKASIAIGYGTFGAVIVCLNGFSAHLVEDLTERRYEQFRALPIAPSADLVGRMVAGFLFMVAAVGVVLGIGALTGATYTVRSTASLPIVIGSLAGFAVLWMVVAVVVAVLVRDSTFASIISVSVAILAYFSTGYNGTVVALFTGPPWLLNVLPHTLATRVMVYHLVGLQDFAGSGMTPPAMPTGPVPLGLLTLYGGVCLVVGVGVLTEVVYQRGIRR